MTRNYVTPVRRCHCGGHPKIVSAPGLWALKCEKCGHQSKLASHLMSAISEWNREMKPKEGAEDGKPKLKTCPTCYRPLINNTAEMRKALERILQSFAAEHYGMEGWLSTGELFALVEEALSAPARNCDRFATVDEAVGAFCTEDNPGGEPRMFVYEAIKWMLAPAPANTDETRHD